MKIDKEKLSAQKSKLSAAKRALLEKQLKGKSQLDRSSEFPPEKLPAVVPNFNDRHLPFPLTDIQHAYWIGRSDLFELGNVATHVYMEIDCVDLEIERFERAWQKLINRHEMLRAIVQTDGKQRILEQVPSYEIAVLDLRKEKSELVASQLAKMRECMSHEILPADEWPLFKFQAARLSEKQIRLYISIDVLIGDAWSFEILGREFFQFFHNPEISLPDLELSFRDYVLGEIALQNSQQYSRSLEYWQSRLATLPPAPELPLQKNLAAIEHPRFIRRTGKLDTDTWDRLKKRAIQAGLTPSGVLLAAFAEILTVWSNNPQFTLNLTLFNRLPLHPLVNQIVGDFTSLTLLEVDNSRQDSFEVRARRIQKQFWDDLEHRYVSGVQVLRELARTQSRASGVLMPVVFTSSLTHESLRNEIPKEQSSPSHSLGEFVYGISQTPQVYLDHQVGEEAGVLDFNWDAVEEVFPVGLLDDLFAAYCNFLERLANEDEIWQAKTRQLLPPAQVKQLAEVNSTKAAVTQRKLLHSLFFDRVSLQPDKTAIITNHRTLTYQELCDRANQLGRRLRQLGAKPNQLIAVVMEKGWEQVVSVLSILAAGAAYVPIDPELPTERRQHLIERGEVKWILTQSWLDSSLEWSDNLTRLCVDTQEISETNEPLIPVQNTDDLAYVIYTSGSTGVPKGVAIDHQGAVNTIVDVNKRFGVRDSDRVLAISSLSFDLSVYDIFGTLAAGGTIVIPDAFAANSPEEWGRLITQHQVTVWNSVPALMQMLIEYATGRSNVVLNSLRLALLSGDWIPLTLSDTIRSAIEDIQIIGLGGATEASIWSIAYPIAKVDSTWKSVPYGKPLTNQRFYVLNETLEPCPIWVKGTLYIGGIGLAKGYWQDEDKTNSSFITHPVTGERLYCTGDRGRYLPDGNIEFLGREDLQVKVRGYRVELGEIEAALEQHPEIRTAIVTTVGKQHAHKSLVAYFLASTELIPSTDELQSFLSKRLPKYTIPAIFVRLDRLPLSSNGKVDRRSLPIPDVAQLQSKVDFVEPRNFNEKALVNIWSEVLGVKPIGIHDNFFELGGDSILSIQIVAKAHQIGLNLTSVQIFEYQTIAELASVVKTNQKNLAEQGLVTGSFPLIPIQKWFFEQKFPVPHHWNQAVFLETKQEIDPFFLEQALQKLQQHHDILRLCFERRSHDWKPLIVSASLTSLTQVNLFDIPSDRLETEVVKVANSFQTSLNLFEGPLLRVGLLNLGANRSSRLLIVIHHLIIDGVSWRIFLEDLQIIYQQLIEEKAMPYGKATANALPLKTTSFKQWAEQLSTYARTEALQNQLNDWLTMLSQPVKSLPVDYPDGDNRVRKDRSISVTLNLEETQALLHEIPAVYETQINDVLLTALVKTFSQWTGEQSLLIDMEGHGREELFNDLDLSRTVGWFTSIYPVLLNLKSSENIGTDLKAIKKQLLSMPQNKIGYGLLRYLNYERETNKLLDALPKAEILFNYLGQFDRVLSESSLFKVASESSGEAENSLNRMPYLLNISAAIEAGKLQVEWNFNEQLYRFSTIETLAQGFLEALRSLINNCQSTRVEDSNLDLSLVELTQEELDLALEQL
jgi:pyochelin synthetase